MVVDLLRSGNGYKTQAVNITISTIRVITKLELGIYSEDDGKEH